jgi:hypothetical protein
MVTAHALAQKFGVDSGMVHHERSAKARQKNVA